MRKLIAGNWKMHNGPTDTKVFVEAFLALNPNKNADWLILPPAVSLYTAQSLLKGSAIKWGAQNIHQEPKGAFTGEMSVGMIKELGCSHSLVGHSERRQYFGETDQSCSQKVKVLQAAGITPILCVGETQAERDARKTAEVVTRQLKVALEGHTKGLPLVIAYEPVWAIGTGRVATPEQAQEVHELVFKLLNDFIGPQDAQKTPILYGGSVKPDNAGQLATRPHIDGFLVGGASLDPKSFAQIG
jgi:triosephosphate isomerase